MGLNKDGFSLVEVIIVVAIMGIVLTGIMLGLSYSTKSTTQAKYRSTATLEAQKAVEFLQKQRYVRGWESFSAIMDANTYCLNELVDEDFLPDPGGCDDTYLVGSLSFSREITVSYPEANKISVEVKVSWPEYKSLTIEHEFMQWD